LHRQSVITAVDKAIFEASFEHRFRLNKAQASLALYSAYAIFDLLIQTTHTEGRRDQREKEKK
jgi:hypothetical protein